MMKLGIILVAQRLRIYFIHEIMNLLKTFYLDVLIYSTKFEMTRLIFQQSLTRQMKKIVS